jgi:zinc transport system substrate-binding protein
MLVRPAALLIAATAVLGACGSDSGTASESTGPVGSGGPGAEVTDVLASFYPLQYVVQQVGGDRVSVSNLTPAGAEPHDVELTADDTARIQDADLVVYLSGFAPAVDDAISSTDAGGRALDVSASARLDQTYSPIDEGEQSGETKADPHFWLDPTRLADVADEIAARLTALDAGGAAMFAANAATLRGRLTELDGEYRDGLATCANTNIVTSHNAFGYLADRYGLTQVGITGLVPDAEPSPQALADVTDFVRDNDVSTIYYETLVSPDIAETVASETGVQTAVLDPIEGLTDDSAGSDYFEVMRSNLATLRSGQGCT